MTPIKEMKTAEMVAEYNQITGKSIKKFATRADGERMLKAARDAKSLITKLIPTPEERVAEKKAAHRKRIAGIRHTEAIEKAKKADKKFVVPVVKHSAFKRAPEVRTVRSVIVQLIMDGKSNGEILILARKEFGKDKVPTSYPSWYRGYLRREGVISY